jgi:hypothetical protein
MLVSNIKGDSAPILEIGRKADFDWALNPSRCATANNTTQITVLGINHATLFMARSQWDVPLIMGSPLCKAMRRITC